MSGLDAVEQQLQPTARPVKKRQHNQLRALLFNRLGLFGLPGPCDEPLASPPSQQPLKEGSVKEEATKPRGGLIRFNSIVSVVAIPNRIQYSSSVRNLLWGKKKKSRRSPSNDNEDLDSTASSEDDPIIPGEKKAAPQPKKKAGGRHRLLRKKSFHG